MGSDPIALPALDLLHEHGKARGELEISAIFTQPDRAKGRGKKILANPIKSWALELGIPVYQPEKPGDETVAWLAGAGIDLVLVMAYGHILRRRLLEIPVLGTFNLHASLLPRYRGASPIETAVACGETVTGVTLMKLVPKMDAGPIVDAEPVPVDTTDTGPDVRAKIAAACPVLLERNWKSWLGEEMVLTEQDSRQATYCRRLSKADALLDFTAAADELRDRIRAFVAWPGAFFEHQGNRLRPGGRVSATQEALAPAWAGTVMRADASGVAVATGSGCLVFHELQRPGGKLLPAASFLNGYRIEPGDRFQGGPMRPLVSDEPFPWHT